MTDDAVTGIALSRAYFGEVVAPLLSARFPGMTYAAGRLGAGSDVLGLDDATSRDHDWGLRLSIFVPTDAVEKVDAELARALPDSFRGHPTRFAFSGETDARHHVDVSTVSGFVESRLGFDPRAGASVRDWLSLSGQAVLEVVAGPVFADPDRELESARRALDWYPDDIWRYALACDWIRLDQELPLMGRAADAGDEAGSRIIAARLAHVVMHLAFLLERRWPPYAKWFGTLFRRLPCAAEIGASVDTALSATESASRQHGIAAALESLLKKQSALGLSDAPRAMIPFWDRPYLHPDPMIITQLLEAVTDPEVRALSRGLGTAEQRTDNVDILCNPAARRAAVAG